MSVVVAIPKNGVVYFGADNQATIGKSAVEIKDKDFLKIQIIGNWVVGFAGDVTTIQLALSILNEIKDKELSKSLLVNEFLPKYIEKALDMGFISKKDKFNSFDKQFPSILIGCKDKLYELSSNLVMRLITPEGVGSGSNYIIYSTNKEMDEKDINKNIIKAIRDFASQNIYVNKGVTLANTRDLKVEVIESDCDL